MPAITMASRATKRTLTEAEKQYRRDYYQRNKARMNEQMRSWRERNREAHLEMTRSWYQENREAHLEASRRWAAEHPEAKRQARRRRRELERNASGFATEQQVTARVAYYGGRCAYCGGPYEELDHVIPLALGGAAWPSNLRPSCRSCNRRKHTRSASALCAQP